VSVLFPEGLSACLSLFSRDAAVHDVREHGAGESAEEEVREREQSLAAVLAEAFLTSIDLLSLTRCTIPRN